MQNSVNIEAERISCDSVTFSSQTDVSPILSVSDAQKHHILHIDQKEKTP